MNDMILQPQKWSSAFREIIFEFDLESRLTGFASDDGFLAFTSVAGAFTHLPAVGEQFFIDGAFEISGLHTITEVISATSFVTSTEYDGGGGGPVTIYHVRLPDVEVWVGYDEGEGYEEDLPLTKIGTIMTERSPDNTIRFDVSGYLQSWFENIAAAPGSGEIDFAVFNRFRLYYDGAYHIGENYFWHVLYATISHDDLNLYFANTGRYLVPDLPAVKFTCGASTLSKIVDDVVRITTFNEGDEMPDGDFDDDDFVPEDFD